jgi:hypothetical protein
MRTSDFTVVLLFVSISFVTMFHCTLHVQGHKGERGEAIPVGQGVRGAHGDAGLPGLPGELVLSDSFLGIW